MLVGKEGTKNGVLRNKTQNWTRKTIRLEFVKKISVLHLSKSFDVSSPIDFKGPGSSIRYNCSKIISRRVRTETLMEIRKTVTLLEVIKRPVIDNFFRRLTGW